MKIPFQVPVNSTYGAPMGRHSTLKPSELYGRVHLRKIPLFDGAYDQGGAYWGMGTPLWCAWNDTGVVYLRALNRKSAKFMLQNAKFYR